MVIQVAKKTKNSQLNYTSLGTRARCRYVSQHLILRILIIRIGKKMENGFTWYLTKTNILSFLFYPYKKIQKKIIIMNIQCKMGFFEKDLHTHSPSAWSIHFLFPTLKMSSRNHLFNCATWEDIMQYTWFITLPWLLLSQNNMNMI